MKHLPWRISDSNSQLIIDAKGCPVVNLNYFGVVGAGHDPSEIADLIVRAAQQAFEAQAEED